MYIVRKVPGHQAGFAGRISHTHSVTIVFSYEGNIWSPNNHINKEKHVLIHLFHLGLCKVPLFYISLQLCGFCPGRPQQNCATGEVSSLDPSEAAVNPPANDLG